MYMSMFKWSCRCSVSNLLEKCPCLRSLSLPFSSPSLDIHTHAHAFFAATYRVRHFPRHCLFFSASVTNSPVAVVVAVRRHADFYEACCVFSVFEEQSLLTNTSVPFRMLVRVSPCRDFVCPSLLFLPCLSSSLLSAFTVVQASVSPKFSIQAEYLP